MSTREWTWPAARRLLRSGTSIPRWAYDEAVIAMTRAAGQGNVDALGMLAAYYYSQTPILGIFRVYEPDEIGSDGYPYVWHRLPEVNGVGIKHIVRIDAGHRCARCGHPFETGTGLGEWSPCDMKCSHSGHVRITDERGGVQEFEDSTVHGYVEAGWKAEAQWRVLTVHHLNMKKHDCRWWNLTPLCQRCHLTTQRRVLMERIYPFEHTEWFKPYAAGWYASSYLHEELNRFDTMVRLDELLLLERLV